MSTIETTYQWTTEPMEMGNAEYLDHRLAGLRNKYSSDQLRNLGYDRLQTEQYDIHRDFRTIRNQFPSPDYTGGELLLRQMRGDNYRGLSPLTIEQEQRIRDCKTELLRNLDREAKRALEEKRANWKITRLASWLNSVADSITPIGLYP